MLTSLTTETEKVHEAKVWLMISTEVLGIRAVALMPWQSRRGFYQLGMCFHDPSDNGECPLT